MFMFRVNGFGTSLLTGELFLGAVCAHRVSQAVANLDLYVESCTGLDSLEMLSNHFLILCFFVPFFKVYAKGLHFGGSDFLCGRKCHTPASQIEDGTYFLQDIFSLVLPLLITAFQSTAKTPV